MPTIFLKILRSKKLLSEWIRIGLAKESIKLKRENAMKNITTTRKLMFDRYLFVSNVSISVILSATGESTTPNNLVFERMNLKELLYY
jgi:hypothetical protein